MIVADVLSLSHATEPSAIAKWAPATWKLPKFANELSVAVTALQAVVIGLHEAFNMFAATTPLIKNPFPPL